MIMAAVTPMTVAIRRKQAFSRARPRVGSARIATVTAAVDGNSSSSQKLAAKATTTANQIRIPKAQELAGTPAKRNGGSIAVVVMRKGRSRLALIRPIGLVVATAAVAEEDERNEATGESHREEESERQGNDAPPATKTRQRGRLGPGQALGSGK